MDARAKHPFPEPIEVGNFPHGATHSKCLFSTRE